MNDRAVYRILVIDDEPTHRILAKEYLEEAGYTVRLAEDGPSGLRMVKRANPDLILVDLMIPGVDGHGLCRMLKSSEATAHVPIILVTASREADVIARGFEAGADDFVTKPVDWEFIGDRVAHVIAKSEERGRLRAEAREMMLQLQNGPASAPETVDPARRAMLESEVATGTLAASGSSEVEACTQAVRQSADAEMQAMELRHAAQIEALHEALSQSRTSAAAALETERCKHARELDVTRIDCEVAVAAARDDAKEVAAAGHQAGIADIRERMEAFQREQEALRRSMERDAETRVRLLEESYSRRLRELGEDRDISLAALRLELHNERESLGNVHAHQIEEIEREAEQRVASATRQVAEIRCSTEAALQARLSTCWDFVCASTTVYVNQVRTISNHVRALSEERGNDANAGALNPRPSNLENSIRILANSFSGMRMLAQMMSGKSALHETTLDLRMVIRNTVAQTRPLADLGRIEIRAELPEDAIWVHADESRVLYAVLALTMNSIRHSPHGAVVKIAVARDEEEGASIHIEDNGVGMAPALIQHLRSCLDQASWPVSEQKMGLGIPIATAIARVHGGTLELESNLGCGTRAVFQLPPGRWRSDADCKPCQSAHALRA